MTNYIPDLVGILVKLMNGNYVSGVPPLWQYICQNVSISLGGGTTSLDPLQLGSVATWSAETEGACQCNHSFMNACIGVYADAGVTTIRGISNAVLDETSINVTYACNPDKVSGIATITFNATTVVEVDGAAHAIIGTLFHCTPVQVLPNISSSITVTVTLYVPFTQSSLFGFVNLNFIDCTLKVGNTKNVSIIYQIETFLQAEIDTLDIVIPGVMDTVDVILNILFSIGEGLIDNFIDTQVLNNIPSNVISNVMATVLGILPLPFVGNLCSGQSSKMYRQPSMMSGQQQSMYRQPFMMSGQQQSRYGQPLMGTNCVSRYGQPLMGTNCVSRYGQPSMLSGQRPMGGQPLMCGQRSMYGQRPMGGQRSMCGQQQSPGLKQLEDQVDEKQKKQNNRSVRTSTNCCVNVQNNCY
jgi:hypothetical protein